MPASVSTSTHRSTRYKEKFQALRERYDQVTAIHDERERELAIATAKCKKLQAENDLLLDAISFTIPSMPSQFTVSLPDQHPLPHRTGGGTNIHPHSEYPPHTAYMNGNSSNGNSNNSSNNNGNSNANNMNNNTPTNTLRHRTLEPYDAEFIVREPNGRLP